MRRRERQQQRSYEFWTFQNLSYVSKSLQALLGSLAQNGLPFVIIQFLKHGTVQICNSKLSVAHWRPVAGYPLLSIRQKNDRPLPSRCPISRSVPKAMSTWPLNRGCDKRFPHSLIPLLPATFSKWQLTGQSDPLTCTVAAQMAELVDAQVSGTCAARRGGSSPLLGTKFRYFLVHRRRGKLQKARFSRAFLLRGGRDCPRPSACIHSICWYSRWYSPLPTA